MKDTTLTTSGLGLPSSEGLSRHFPVQYVGSGEPEHLMGNIVLPYHDSFFSILSVEMKSDFFDLGIIGDIFAGSKVPGDDPDRRHTSNPKRRIS